MKPFEHHSPNSLEQAFDLITQDDNNSYYYAGGTDINLQLKSGILAAESLISLKNLSELKGIEYKENNGLKLGALTTLRELQRTKTIYNHYPALSQAAGLMASEQIRSFATLGGNLCNAAPSADLAPPLIALGAIATISSKFGEHKVPIEDFFLGPGETVLEEGEILMQITVPPPNGETLFIKHTPRMFMDISVVCIAIRLLMNNGICNEIRIALGAVAPVPLRAVNAEAELAAQPFSSNNISRAAQIAAEECSPINDIRGTAAYRRRMIEVLVRRGLSSLNENYSKV
ncbi:MAG: xanthine dehydrogenase family protein subunit M [Chloroflexi bacterium]|nr:xanthine dehydrogenase family protein subunit M [Chloroflexota bacterium]